MMKYFIPIGLLAFITGVNSVTVDMINGTEVVDPWLETGFVSISDRYWTSVETLGTTFKPDSVIFVSLPDVGGRHYTTGTPTSIRITNKVYNNGVYTFDMKLFHPNDSYCSKEFYIPKYLEKPVLISWVVANKGVYNISGHQFVLDSGLVNRTHNLLAGVGDTVDVFNFEFPTGCNASNPSQICAYRQSLPLENLGAVSTIQTFVNEHYLLTRTSRIRRRDVTIILTPHDSSDPSYFMMGEHEEVAYMVFETGVVISCVERVTFETVRFDDVTSEALYYSYHFSYKYAPGIYGSLISQNSLVDSTGVRVFERTVSDAYVITQEDQCVENQTIHTTEESVAALVVGELYSAGTEVCVVNFVPLEFGCDYTILLYDLFGDGWGNIELVVTTDGFSRKYSPDCSCLQIDIYSDSCNITLNMTSDGDPIAPWEVLWVTEIGGETWVGDFDSTLKANNQTVWFYDDMVDYDPESDVNACHECKHPPPKPKPGPGGSKGKDDDTTTGDDKATRDDTTTGDDGAGDDTVGDDAVGGDDTAAGDDGASGGDGKGDGNGKGSGKGAGKGKGKRPPAKVIVDLFDHKKNGWYDDSGDFTDVCEGDVCGSQECEDEEIQVPNILHYPQYFIMNEDRTKLIKSGTICSDNRGVEFCEEVLPHDGRFVFRVAGENPPGDNATWSFCGRDGGIKEELQFSMRAGKCHPGDQFTADDYCSGVTTLLSIGAVLTITDVSAGTLSEFDTKTLQQQLTAVVPVVRNVKISSYQLSGSNIEVQTVIVVAVEDYGLDGTIFSNKESVFSTVSDALASPISSGAFLSVLQNSLRNSPQGASDVLLKATSVSIDTVEMSSYEYVMGMKTDSETTESAVEEETVTSSSKSNVNSSPSGTVLILCGAVAGVIAVAFVIARAVRKSRMGTPSHLPLPDNSEHVSLEFDDNAEEDTIPTFELNVQATQHSYFKSSERV
mmetsp:Transcript_3084/g.4739  ORF Transcript_3084/g.4739 Transcript_3084/m.4739 type:complete len:952 (-) Transcript_3084:169-3024(-)